MKRDVPATPASRTILAVLASVVMCASLLVGCSEAPDVDVPTADQESSRAQQVCEQQRLAVWDLVQSDANTFLMLDFAGCVAKAHELDSALPEDWGTCPNDGVLSFDFANEPDEVSGIVCSIHGVLPLPE